MTSTTKPLNGMSFCLTGTLQEMTRKEAIKLIKKAGGKVTTGITLNTDVVIAGIGAGQKLTQAQDEKIPIWYESKLYKKMNYKTSKKRKLNDSDSDSDSNNNNGPPKKKQKVSNKKGGRKLLKVGNDTVSVKNLEYGQQLIVVEGDISEADLNCNCIVHPTDNRLKLNGKVGIALRDKGGIEIENDIKQWLINNPSGLDTNDVCVTKAGNLNVEFLINVNSPMWNNGNGKKDLKECILNILEISDDGDHEYIALPAIGSGINGFPPEIACKIILQTIDKYFKNNKKSIIKEIYFVLYGQEMVDIYEKELQNL